MRVKAWTKNTGMLIVDGTDGRTHNFEFPLSSLEDWYPLHPGYEYRYSPKTGTMSLYAQKGATFEGRQYWEPSKGNRFFKKEPHKGTGTLVDVKGNNWHAPKVAKENQAIAELARMLGIHTLDDFYTSDEVAKDLEIVLNLTADITSSILDEEKSKGTKIVNEYDVEKAINQGSTEEQDEMYLNLGEILTMLGVMRRVSDV